MKENFPNIEAQPPVEKRLREEEGLLKKFARSNAGRWLTATMLALSVEAAAPTEAKAQDFFGWYHENFETEISGGIDPTGGGMGTLTIRERTEESRRHIRHEDEDESIVRDSEPRPVTEHPVLQDRDRRAHPEDYEDVELPLPREFPVAYDLIQSGRWETELLPDHVYVDEDGRRFLMRSISADASDEEFMALGADVHRWFNGRIIPRDSRVIANEDGAVERFLFEAPALIDTERLEGNWVEDLEPGRVYEDDSGRVLTVAVVQVAFGARLLGRSAAIQTATSEALHVPCVVLDQHTMMSPPLWPIDMLTDPATGRSRVVYQPSIVRYLVAERIVDSEGHPIDPGAREMEAMRLARSTAERTEM